MIDLHAHILPRLDDGAQTLDESIEMCRRSYRDGIRTIVATPHILDGIYPNRRTTILAKVEELNAAIVKCGMHLPPGQAGNVDRGVNNLDSKMACHSDSGFHTPNSDFRVFPGADVHFSPDMPELCENGEMVTVNDKGRTLMVEFDFQGIPIMLRMSFSG